MRLFLGNRKDFILRQDKIKIMGYDTVVIYHSRCPDGIASAWAFSKSKNFGTVVYHGTNERDFHKDEKIPDLTEKCVYIVDYCYPPNVLEEIKGKASFLKVIDHHKSAMNDFETIPDYCFFDTSKCASELVWDYVHGENFRPWFLKHIRDRDLWLWENPNSKAFSQEFFKMGLDFRSLDILLDIDPEIVYERGRKILEFTETTVGMLCKSAELVSFEGYKIYSLNSPIYQSECGSELSARKECDFALVYRYKVEQKEWWISLRGNKEKEIDLVPIAKKYGGGGHPLSSGFSYKGNISDLFKISY